MRTIERKVTYTIEMSGDEREALRLLSNRVRVHECYMGGSEWRNHLVDILGEEMTQTIENLFKEEE